MYLDYTPAQRELREELRAYFARLMTPDLQAELSWKEGGGPLYRQALRQMGRDGWLGIGWPQEYGGQGRSPIEQFIFSDEVQRAGFPLLGSAAFTKAAVPQSCSELIGGPGGR